MAGHSAINSYWQFQIGRYPDALISDVITYILGQSFVRLEKDERTRDHPAFLNLFV
jgi:hypothetical protein